MSIESKKFEDIEKKRDEADATFAEEAKQMSCPPWFPPSDSQKPQGIDVAQFYAEKEDFRRARSKKLFGKVDVEGITAVGNTVEGLDKAEVFKKIEGEIENRFPHTYNILDSVRWGDFLTKLKDSCVTLGDVSEIDEYIHKITELRQIKKEQPLSDIDIFEYYFHRKKFRGGELYLIASFIKGGPININSPIEDVEAQLRGKKILVLGDDTGSFSEILNSFGAEVSGIEYDKIKVITAHSGILAESGLPQDHVVQGDIGDLTNRSSRLYQIFLEHGPFDVIYSYAVFNSGSGIEGAIKNVIGQYDEDKFGKLLINGLNNLLNEKGFCLHTRVDMNGMFGKYGGGTGLDRNLVFMPKFINQ